MYAKFGAVPTGKTNFNEEFAPHDWDGHSKPPIVAMRLPDNLSDVVKSYNPGVRIRLNRVRYYKDYEAMEASSKQRGAFNLVRRGQNFRRHVKTSALGMVSG